MLSSFTYDELVEALQSWPEDTASEYTDDIPRLIDLGQTRVVRDLNLEIFDVSDSTIVMTGGSRVVVKPEVWVSTRSLFSVIAGVREPLLLRSRDWCTNYAPNPAVTGFPKYYFEASDTTWNIVATPAVSGNIQADMVARPTAITINNQTNWISTRVGDLLFAACLMEAEHWIKADDRYADIKGKYAGELLPVARLELRNLIRNGDSYTPYKPAASKAG